MAQSREEEEEATRAYKKKVKSREWAKQLGKEEFLLRWLRLGGVRCLSVCVYFLC
jgi:hypothetical protein